MNRAFDTYVHCAQDKYYHIAWNIDIVSKKPLNQRIKVVEFLKEEASNTESIS